MTKEQLLAEVEDVLRTMPSGNEVSSGQPAALAWVGRAAAVITRWEGPRVYMVDAAVDDIQSRALMQAARGFSKLISLLHTARADLQMEVGQLSVVVPQGRVFEYFEELRKAIETARTEAFFVDPYLDADFVGRYLPYVVGGVTVRLLGREKMAALLPAVDMFAKQSGLAIHVRSSTTLHDRFLFVDRSVCYLSGASFKDGAMNAPATLTQIADAFTAMLNTYDQLWASGKVERP